MKILIIEPDEYYHNQYRDHIGQVAELRFTNAVSEALRMIEAEPFDMVVTELILADGHAYDFLSKLRHVPVVIYSKVAHLEDVQECLNLGVSGYFLKGHDTINDVKKLVLTYVPELLTTNY